MSERGAPEAHDGRGRVWRSMPAHTAYRLPAHAYSRTVGHPDNKKINSLFLSLHQNGLKANSGGSEIKNLRSGVLGGRERIECESRPKREERPPDRRLCPTLPRSLARDE